MGHQGFSRAQQSQPSSPWQSSDHQSSQDLPPQESLFQTTGSAWDLPSARQLGGATASDKTKGLTMKPPRFDGLNSVSWISRVQFYFDHFMLPEDHRLHYSIMLFDPSVADWIFNYWESNSLVKWSEFLEDVRRRFDPKCFVDYFGVIAKLSQTGSLENYNTEFEGMLNRVYGVPESRLVILYVEGLQQPVRNQVKFLYPQSVAAAIALAVEFDAAIEHPSVQPPSQRRPWQPREPRHQQSLPHSTEQPNTSQQLGHPNQPPTKGSDFLWVTGYSADWSTEG